ncbi:MAG: hypothetical protein AAGI23_09730 [Bacteroidota bacterium]
MKHRYIFLAILTLFMFDIASAQTKTDTTLAKSSGPGDRPIFFIHGLGGNEYAWAKAQEGVEFGTATFDARKAETEELTYAQASMNSAAITLRGDMEKFFQGIIMDSHIQKTL